MRLSLIGLVIQVRVRKYSDNQGFFNKTYNGFLKINIYKKENVYIFQKIE